MKRRVIIESPYAGDVALNVTYARALLADSIRRGEAPIASHLLYTQILDDSKPDERELGIEAGLAWHPAAELIVFGIDLGMSRGMEMARERAVARGYMTEQRSLPDWAGFSRVPLATGSRSRK